MGQWRDKLVCCLSRHNASHKRINPVSITLWTWKIDIADASRLGWVEAFVSPKRDDSGCH